MIRGMLTRTIRFLRYAPRVVRAAQRLRDQPFFNETGGPSYRELGRAVDAMRGVPPYLNRHERKAAQ